MRFGMLLHMQATFRPGHTPIAMHSTMVQSGAWLASPNAGHLHIWAHINCQASRQDVTQNAPAFLLRRLYEIWHCRVVS